MKNMLCHSSFRGELITVAFLQISPFHIQVKRTRFRFHLIETTHITYKNNFISFMLYTNKILEEIKCTFKNQIEMTH
jgi:hypothetical protein